MLVLSRKPGQSIFINGDIRITVVSIRGNQVRIGIEAPASVSIFRDELCEPARASQGTARRRPPGRPTDRSMPGSTDALRAKQSCAAIRDNDRTASTLSTRSHNPCCAGS